MKMEIRNHPKLTMTSPGNWDQAVIFEMSPANEYPQLELDHIKDCLFQWQLIVADNLTANIYKLSH